MEHDPAPSDFDLVAAFSALAHPQRLGVVRLLMQHYPRRVAAGEIGAALGLKPSTLSGYLAQLMEAGLITQERRATSLLYAAAPEGAQALSAEWIGAVCGGRAWPEGCAPGQSVCNVLFLGLGNAGPSLIAEALLRSEAGDRFEAFSAGLSPEQAELSDALSAALSGAGHDTGPLWSKPFSTWTGPDAPRMDIVITLGDRAASQGRDWPGMPHRAAWRLAENLTAEALIADLSARVAQLARLNLAEMPSRQVQAILDGLAEPAEA